MVSYCCEAPLYRAMQANGSDADYYECSQCLCHCDRMKFSQGKGEME